MIALVTAVINLLILIFRNITIAKDKKEEEKKALLDEAKEAIKSGDIGRVNAIIVKLRK